MLVPASADEPECAVVSDLFAEQFRRRSHISDVRESSICVRIRFEASALTMADFVLFECALPKAELIDVSDAIAR